MGLEIMNALI